MWAADPSSLTIKADNPPILIPTEDNRPAEEVTARAEAQLTTELSRATVASVSKPLLPLTNCLLVDSGALSPLTAEISSAEKALCDASEIMKTMKTKNLHDTWRNAFTKIEWVMNVVSPITEVRTIFHCCQPVTNLTSVWQLHPYAKMAWCLLSMIPQVDLLSLLSQECAYPLLIWMPDFLETGTT